MSPAGQDLIRWMIQDNGKTRLSAAQCLAHCWFDPIRAEVAALPAFGRDRLLLSLARTK